ncbi:sensor histidine kinase [Chitinophaga sp. MD30]|uniref:sensor histidine kinase n=2 Tax=Chitinophaga TaxID=79328 RepID=UPI000BAEFF66|nr:sensor histidine kinase [Chitinophaga sp. MD30]ASZ14550.1 hypothetical protein CK934_28165 [Chitinophaga sp. MD30]
MQSEFPEIYIAIVTSTMLLLVLAGFIVIMVVLNQKKQLAQNQELNLLKERYEQELLRSQLEIQEATFGDIAQEIHDNIGQSLTFVSISLATAPITADTEAASYLDDCRKMLNKAITELADLSKGLHTDRIAEIGLVKAIQFELNKLERFNLFKTSFIFTDIRNLIDAKSEIIIFRIVQEVFNNILKHARAKILEVKIFREQDKIYLQITDDGIGFDPTSQLASTDQHKGLGLRNMKKRAMMIGGSFYINSVTNGGTTIRICIPVIKQSFHEHPENEI